MEKALKQMQDIVHLGKVATDLLPGFLFLAAFFVGLTAAGRDAILIVPFQGVQDLERRAHTVEAALAEVDQELLRQIGGRLEVRDDPLALQVLAEKERLKREERLRLRAELEGFRDEIRDAHLLTKNIDALADHAFSLAFISLLIGIGLAQVAGGVFYSGLFRRRFHAEGDGSSPARAEPGIDELRAKIRDVAFLDRLPDLDRGSYRYLEIAMNLILPTALLGLALVAAGGTRGSWVIATAGLIVLACIYPLTRHAYDQYKSYHLRRDQVKRVLEWKLKGERVPESEG